MSIKDLTYINLLDKVRFARGTDGLRNFFSILLKNNKEEAISLINNSNLSFTSLFILKTDLEKSVPLSYLNIRNQVTFRLIDELLKKTSPTDEGLLIHGYDPKLYTVLRWILETGFSGDGLSDEYDEILDVISVILITEFKDMTILPIVAHMIFNRNKKGTLIHDLVWAIFQSEVPQSLTLIAERLLSPNRKDIELARKLLSFIPEIDMSAKGDNGKQYLSFVSWLRENGPFLLFTGESLQQCSTPSPCAIRLDSKYLCKPTLVNNSIRSNLASEKESELLKIFNSLEKHIQVLLSKFSFKLYRQNPYFWYMWINYPIVEQINIARKEIGGFL